VALSNTQTHELVSHLKELHLHYTTVKLSNIAEDCYHNHCIQIWFRTSPGFWPVGARL